LTADALSQARLYGILDLSYVAASNAASVAEQMIAGGVDLIQLRAKNQAAADIVTLATELIRITRSRRVPLMINDYSDIARSAAADGVHVGQDDPSVGAVRQVVGENCIIGKSTHSVEQAIRAFHEGADYIGFGPISQTPTKPDYRPIGLEQIQQVHEAVPIPIFCIGGIKLDNLPQVMAAGARRIVIVSGLLQAPDIASYARSVKQLLAKSRNSIACM
jgi:thiamine-phosphate pyrophosphorylase